MTLIEVLKDYGFKKLVNQIGKKVDPKYEGVIYYNNQGQKLE